MGDSFFLQEEPVVWVCYDVFIGGPLFRHTHVLVSTHPRELLPTAFRDPSFKVCGGGDCWELIGVFPLARV